MTTAQMPAPPLQAAASSIHFTGTIARTVASFVGCSLVAMVLVLSDQRLLHWFVIPVVLCGAIIGSDAISFLQGKVELMDPAAILGLLGLHFFFLAPLLHVVWDAWMPYIVGPPEWRDWLGWMAVLNLIGLLLFRFVSLFGGGRNSRTQAKTTWTIDDRRAIVVFAALLLVSGLAQLWVYIHYGGISGYIDAYLDGEHHYGNKDPGVGFNGMGWIFTISESFPILAMFTVAHLLKKRSKPPPWTLLFGALVLYFVLVMLFGGLRGSRSNTVWALFWAVGVIHFRVRKVTRPFILVGVSFLVVFLYLYGFYKSVGAEALDAFQGSDARDNLAHKTGRTLQGAVLEDLGRSDIQAFILYKTSSAPENYDYAWGRTYIGAAAILIPRSLWPDRPPTKIRWITELESGPGTFTPGMWESSHVLGLAGEGMLNFGPVAVPLAYAVLGIIVVYIRSLMNRLAPNDSRWLMAPLVIMFTFIVMAGDADNDIFFLVKYAAMPLLAVVLSSRRTRIRSWSNVS
jgi:hypothetical protein